MYTRYQDKSMARFVQARNFCVVLFCVLEFRGVGSDLKGIISRQAIVLS